MSEPRLDTDGTFTGSKYLEPGKTLGKNKYPVGTHSNGARHAIIQTAIYTHRIKVRDGIVPPCHSLGFLKCVCVCMRVYVHLCECECVRACLCVCVCVCTLRGVYLWYARACVFEHVEKKACCSWLMQQSVKCTFNILFRFTDGGLNKPVQLQPYINGLGYLLGS